MSALHETEAALLQVALNRPSECAGIELDPDHFTVESHAAIWSAIQRLTADGLLVDPITVMDLFEREGKRALATHVLTVAAEGHITTQPQAYADRIRAAWRCRRAAEIAAELSERAAARDEGAVDDAVAALMDLHRVQRGAEWTMKQSARAMFERLSAITTGEYAPGIPTGITRLDELLGGLHDGDLIVLGARPAMGKTALLLNMARHAARRVNGSSKPVYPVGIVSGEQPHEQVGGRVLSMASGIAASKMRSAQFEDEEWSQITRAMAEMADMPAYILDRSAPHISEVIRVARRWKARHGIRALYVDYLQRIEGDGERRHEAVAQVAKSLKNLARELSIPVVVLAQVNRNVEARSDKRPRMSDLSDSSEIEKEADQVMLLYRDDYYDPDSQDAGTAEIIIDKNRHGETGFVRVAWIGKTMQFADYERGGFDE